MTLSSSAIDEIRGAYAMRFDSMLDASMQAVSRHTEDRDDPAELRRRLHGLLRGIITSTLNPVGDAGLGVVAELGERLHGLSNGSPEALLDIQLTLFDQLTSELLEAYPELRPTVQHMLLHVSFGWIGRSIGAPLAPDPAIPSSAGADDTYRQMILQSPRPMFLIDVKGGTIVEYGPSTEQLFGYTLDEEKNLPPEAFVTEETPEDDYDLLIDMLEGRLPHLERQTTRRHRDGTTVAFTMLGWPVRNAEGEITHLAHLLTPTPSRELTPAHLTMTDARIHFLAQLSSDPIFVVSTERVIQYASPSVERALGLVPADLVGTALDGLVADVDQGRMVDVVTDVLTGPRRQATVELRLTQSDGEIHWYEVVAANLLDVDDVQGIALQGRNISYRKDLEQRLEHLAMVDPLTQTLNRRGFLAALDEALIMLGPGQYLRVAYIDLDDFKAINDHLGHLAGDAVLTTVAQRLVEVLGNHGQVGRIGGDEFVLFTHAHQRETLDALEAEVLIRLAEPHTIEGQIVESRGTVGSAEYQQGMTETSLTLLQRADRALYANKHLNQLPMSQELVS